MDIKPPRSVKWLAVFSTIVYLFTFPAIADLMGLYFFMFIVSKEALEHWPYFLLFLLRFIPIPLSIFLVWYTYYKKEYKKTCIFCVLFFVMTIGFFIYNSNQEPNEISEQVMG